MATIDGGQMRSVAPLRPTESGQLRLLAKVARMYHERGLRQSDIAEQLHISQPRVSRLLKQAVEAGIVRTTVVLPPGVNTDLEDELSARYGLRDSIVVDNGASIGHELPALGAAAASYLESTLIRGEVVGISSWSATLLATAEAMRPFSRPVADRIVQIVGGHGYPGVQMQATRLVDLLAGLTGAEPVLLPAPVFLGSSAVRDVIAKEPTVAEAMASWGDLTCALVGIGSLEPSPLLRQSGNAVTEEDQAKLRSLGAVGDVCLRFFDEHGEVVPSHLEERVLGITPEQLKAVDRRVGVAGGLRKLAAIRAALRGRWINVLVTDRSVAEALLADQPDTVDGTSRPGNG